ncbi:hypothetical protein GZH49_37755 [Nocardia terpenica]|uniref:hypothetical protein n=1 Tax=Nocardia terpenica TaxID=455432 RepID=UPI002FE2570A
MGVRIKSTGASYATETYSIVENGGRAARQSLERAEVRPDQIGVLINTGIFHDSNFLEPACAAMIQKAAGIGLDYTAATDPRTFSFDLMNSAVGVLHAVQVAAAIMDVGTVEHILVVSGDTHPSLTRAVADDEFPYAASGAALLLEYTDGADGFGRVHTVSGEGMPGLEAYFEVTAMGIAGRGLMTVVRETDFEDRLLEVAVEAARRTLDDVRDIDISGIALISSTPSPTFPHQIAEAVGISGDSVRTADLSGGDPHTASLSLAYDRALMAGSLADRSHVLFVAAGAGPTAAAALYQLPTRTAI